jgi:hypothetical protein
VHADVAARPLFSRRTNVARSPSMTDASDQSGARGVEVATYFSTLLMNGANGRRLRDVVDGHEGERDDFAHARER